MKINIVNGEIENWDNYSVNEKKETLYTLSNLRKLEYERIRLITNVDDIQSDDPEELKESASFIGKEIIWPAKGIITGIEETFEDYYYVVQTELDIDYIPIYAKLTLKDNE